MTSIDSAVIEQSHIHRDANGLKFPHGQQRESNMSATRDFTKKLVMSTQDQAEEELQQYLSPTEVLRQRLLIRPLQWAYESNIGLSVDQKAWVRRQLRDQVRASQKTTQG